MKERPILMQADMVRAVLDGRKTQTRRVIKDIPTGYRLVVQADNRAIFDDPHSPVVTGQRCPYGVPGDRLWVRENVVILKGDYMSRPTLEEAMMYGPSKDTAIYPASDSVFKGEKITPSIHMPRWASRITLEVTGVRVERVQDISEEDAKNEGARFFDGSPIGHSGWRHDEKDVHDDARSSFARLWDSINAKRGFGWGVNPWVWVVEFRRLKQ